ncbi:hypothetical protein [Streptomyces sp. NPDC021020]|uniref:hypothetical protein n=1 Tax=Streptomyces sp. NPDC021020 TaxID=3365109 RepID=UPI00379E04DA
MAVHDMTAEGRGSISRLDTAAGQDPADRNSADAVDDMHAEIADLMDSGISVYEARAAVKESQSITDEERAEAHREGYELGRKIARRKFRY